MPRHKRNLLTLQRGKHVQNGLVLSYPFSEGSGDPRDHSGQSNDATISSATWSDTQYGDGLTFNGSSDYMTFPDTAVDFTSGDFSIVTRVYINALNANGIVAGNGTFNTDGWWFTIGADGGLVLWTFQAAAFDLSAANAATVAAGSWYTIACLRADGVAVNFHVDGGDAAAGDTSDVADPVATGGASVYVAKRPDAGQYADITMTDLRIYNRLLDRFEISLIHSEFG